MNSKTIAGILIILSVTILPVAAIFAYDAYISRQVDAELIARAPERGNFEPRVIEVPVGEKFKLRVRNVDTVEHGFAVPDLDVNVGAIKAGNVAWVEFTPEKTGTYPFYCTVWCSEQHLQMRGQIQVVEK